jgi:Na+/H+ antiporter NhaD/arsenite permease-like protein
MSHEKSHGGNSTAVAAAILAVIAFYLVALLAEWPQKGTEHVVEAAHHEADANELADEPAEHAEAGKSPGLVAPPLWTVIPFALLLLAIALLPLIPFTERWWDSNLSRFLVAMALAIVTLGYYLFLHADAIEGHFPGHRVVEPSASGPQFGFLRAILENAILQEFIPFIVLLFSLFTISGGIRITGDLQAHPMTNAMFLLVGALLASFIGTTGAAMLLIRPLLETNRERKRVVHTIVFFIFIVCNCGGCLLPIGDPPLFLGYLEGVPFLWTLVLWKEWAFVNGVLIVLYLLLDGLWHYRKEKRVDIQRDVAIYRRLKISGWQVNAPLLVGVVLAVALLDPSKPVPGTNWHPWMYLREVVQLGLVWASLRFGNQEVRAANKFNFHAIVEVAALFSGIFITMQPALQILSVRGDELGIQTPAQFFWATGLLSSVLDNAPTYLVFFQTAQAMTPVEPLVAGVNERILMGISLGAVFMGALTYIGNGPNFMVRAIAEKSGVKMPSFFGYMVYSCLILLPLFAAMIAMFFLFPY